MGLKNYTSKVPAVKSIAHIEMLLLKNGATQILKTVDEKQKRFSGIKFSICNNGDILNFHLPCNLEAVEKVLMSDTTPRTTKERIKAIPKQAERTAWKILYDWTEIQMAMIELAQLDIKQVFLAHLINPTTGKTVYQMIEDKNFQPQLMDGKQSRTKVGPSEGPERNRV